MAQSPRRRVVIRGRSQQFGERSLDGSSSHLDPELPTLGEGGTHFAGSCLFTLEVSFC